MSHVRTNYATVVMLFASLLVLAQPALLLAERPSAPKLLPKDTLAFLRVTDVKDLAEKYRQTSTGRISEDEKIKPFLLHLYGSAVEAFEQLQDQIGVSLPDLMKVPQGEICLALVAPAEGPLAVVALLDVGEDAETVDTLIKKAEEALEDGGARRTTEMVGDTELVIHEGLGDGRGAIHFVKDGTIVVCSDRSVTEDLLVAWKGTDKNRESLLDNRKFVTIMRRCSGTKDERPQISFYADPIQITRTATRGNFAVQTALALFPALGLDGLQGVGGGIILAPEEFDSISHFHVLLDNPRRGVVDMFAFKPGDLTPENWAPADAASYVSLNWDVQKTYKLLHEMIDEFNGEGTFNEQVGRRINEPIGIDLEKDLIEVLDGRLTYLSWIEKPVRLNSSANLVGVKFKDVDHFRRVFEELMKKYEERFTKRSLGSITYYQVQGNGDRQDQFPDSLRRPEPCLGIVGDYLLLSDSSKLMQRAISSKDDNSQSLASALDFKLVASRIARHTGDAKPAMISFSRPEEGMRLLYDLAKAPETRSFLDSGAEDNPALRALANALKDQPLPEFEELAKYLAPAGGMMTSDETGLHFTSFGLKRQ